MISHIGNSKGKSIENQSFRAVDFIPGSWFRGSRLRNPVENAFGQV